MSSSDGIKRKNLLIDVIKGALVSVSITLVLILLFAVIVRFLNISDSWIFPINQVIKVISIIFGVIVLLKNNREKGFLKGLLLGIIYFLLSFFVFSILQGNFSFALKNLYDLLLTTLMGGLVGIIYVNIKK